MRVNRGCCSPDANAITVGLLNVAFWMFSIIVGIRFSNYSDAEINHILPNMWPPLVTELRSIVITLTIYSCVMLTVSSFLICGVIKRNHNHLVAYLAMSFVTVVILYTFTTYLVTYILLGYKPSNWYFPHLFHTFTFFTAFALTPLIATHCWLIVYKCFREMAIDNETYDNVIINRQASTMPQPEKC